MISKNGDNVLFKFFLQFLSSSQFKNRTTLILEMQITHSLALSAQFKKRKNKGIGSPGSKKNLVGGIWIHDLHATQKMMEQSRVFDHFRGVTILILINSLLIRFWCRISLPQPPILPETSPKCVSGITEQLLKTAYAYNNCSWQNRRKTLRGVSFWPPLLLYVRELQEFSLPVCFFWN